MILTISFLTFLAYNIEVNNKHQGKLIAVHPKQQSKGNFCTNPTHYPKYKMYSDTEYQEKYQVKMAEVGSYAEQVFFIVVQQHPADWTRTVQGILSLVKSYSKEVVNLACKRAIAVNACQYQIIKNICFNGSYNLPVEFNFKEDNL